MSERSEFRTKTQNPNRLNLLPTLLLLTAILLDDGLRGTQIERPENVTEQEVVDLAFTGEVVDVKVKTSLCGERREGKEDREENGI